MLKHWRKLAGMSQAQLAAKLGYHHSVISRWESGARQPPLNRVRRLDAVLDTGGQLAQLNASTAARGGGLPGMGPDSPLPGGFTSPGVLGVAWEPAEWPARLPHHGLTCPLHADHGCEIPPADQAVAIHAAFTADPCRTDREVIHVLAAQAAVYTRIGDEHGPVGIDTAVEGALHLIVRSLTPSAGPNRQSLLHLAATYASLAGQLRTLRGQYGAAMGLYGKALHWAMLCDDMSLRAALMCDMSALARLEYDARSVISYAGALPAIGPNRAWTSALSHLHLARGHGMLGNLRETSDHAAAARDNLDRLTVDDEQEAPWIAGIHGQVHVEAGIGGALRDVAAATADRGVAQAAIAATEHSLAFVPTELRPATVLLALRLADCYACAGQPEAAVAIATPVLAEATSIPMSTISHEMRGLRGRLAARWPNLALVRGCLDRGWH